MNCQVTDTFVDTAITMSKRVLNSDRLLNLLLKADEHGSSDNPFNHYSKMQLMINKGKTAKNIEWIFFAMHLCLRHGYI